MFDVIFHFLLLFERNNQGKVTPVLDCTSKLKKKKKTAYGIIKDSGLLELKFISDSRFMSWNRGSGLF